MSKNPNKSTKCSQYFVAFAAAFGAMAQSATVCWASPNGPQQLDYVKLTDEQIPWVSSSLTLSAGFMCILTGYFANFIGRKTAMLLLVIPFTFGWILIIYARHFIMVIMGRSLLGIATGGVCVLVPIYIAEIAETKIRGVLCYLFQLLSTAGTIIVNFPITTSHMSWVCAAIPLIFGTLVLFCPESPTYLMQKNRRDDASMVLLRLRGRKYDPSIELNAIRASLNKQPLQRYQLQQEQQLKKQQQLQQQQRGEQQKQEQQQTRKQRLWSRALLWYRDNQFQHQYKYALRSLLRPSSVKALFISYGLFICQQMCGINILQFYAGNIFAAVNQKNGYSTLLTALVGFVATLLSMSIADRIRRRTLLLGSQIVITLCSLLLAYHFPINESNSSKANDLNWIPLAALLTSTVAFSIGLGPVPWVIFGEIFPVEIKCLAGSISTSANLMLAYITTTTHKRLAEVLGASGIFWLYTSFSLLGTVFVYVAVPETKGISLHNIPQLINEVQPDSDELLEDSDNVEMKELGDSHKGKFFTL